MRSVLRPKAFFEGLKALGYFEGQNITIERREALGKTQKLDQLAQELLALQPDLIVTVTTPAAVAAQKATRTIPIVILIVSDPVALGFVQSLARPGGNIMGTSNTMIDVSRKRVQLLNEILPPVSRVAVLWNSLNPAAVMAAKQTELGAAALGIEVESLEYSGPNELEAALTKATRAQALLIVGDVVTFDRREWIAAFAVAYRLPVFSVWPEEAKDGFLAACGPSLQNENRRAAVYVDKILRGAKPAELPIEEPTKYELIINLKTARALDLRIPPSILLRADRVIE